MKRYKLLEIVLGLAVDHLGCIHFGCLFIHFAFAQIVNLHSQLHIFNFFPVSLHEPLKGEMEVTPACYTHLLSSLLSLASGRVAVVLEGGYCLESLAEGAALTLRTLLGDPCPKMEALEAPSERFVNYPKPIPQRFNN